MNKITFYGGVNEIGGTKILVETKESAFFLDFGRSFAGERKYFDWPLLQPRKVDTLLKLGLLPSLRDIYKTKENRSFKETQIEGVFITHAHTDHCDYIRWLRDDIKVYATPISQAIILAREASSHPISTEYRMACFKDGVIIKEKEIIPVEAERKVRLKGCEIKPLKVDHSVPGAAAYLVQAEGLKLAYTGDFRCHGSCSQLTEEFIEKAAKFNPDVLIIEGTNIARGSLSTEAEVEAKISKLVSRSNGLILASFSIVDFDRLKTFYQVAKSNKRKIAVSTKQIFILHSLCQQGLLAFPDEFIDELYVFYRKKEKLLLWEKKALNLGLKEIDIQEVEKHQSEFILSFSYYDMNEAIEIKFKPGSVFILSQSEPFNEEMEIDFQKLLNWLEYFGLPIYTVHASGHASAFELREVVERVKPKKVFLVHTDRPRLYANFLSDLSHSEFISPEESLTYKLNF